MPSWQQFGSWNCTFDKALKIHLLSVLLLVLPLLAIAPRAMRLGVKNGLATFLNFVTRYDIVPRISLTPLSAIEQQLQQVLDFFNSKSKFYKQEHADQVPGFFVFVMENASCVASYAACNTMGSTNLLLETLSSFIKLSPYTPLGTYVFCIDNRKLVVERNPDAILQILFNSSQLSTVEEKVTVARGSLRDHLNYKSKLYLVLIVVR